MMLRIICHLHALPRIICLAFVLACQGGPVLFAGEFHQKAIPESSIHESARQQADREELRLAAQTLGLGEIPYGVLENGGQQYPADATSLQHPDTGIPDSPSMTENTGLNAIRWLGTAGAVVLLMRSFRRL